MTKQERQIYNAGIKFLITQGRTKEYAQTLLDDSFTHPFPKVWCKKCLVEDCEVRRIVLGNDLIATNKKYERLLSKKR